MEKKEKSVRGKKKVTGSSGKMKKTRVKKSQAGSSTAGVTKKRTNKTKPSEIDVRVAAYYNYLNRGCTHGYHEDDWYQAEKKLKNKPKKKKKPS